MKGEKILVTGAGGFIGKHLTKFLSSHNHVYGTLLDGESNEFLTGAYNVDISSLNDLSKLPKEGFDHVFHLAGIADVKRSIESPVRDFEVNALGTLNLLEVFRGYPLKSFILTSSVSVLSSHNKLPLSENAEYGPTTPYAASKMSAEGYCKAYKACYDLPCKIVRLFNVYGPGRKGLVIYDLIEKLIQNPYSLTINGNGEQIRDFLYIDDVVSGLSLIATNGVEGEVYNLASGNPVSIKELAQIILMSMGLSSVEIHTTNQKYSGEFLKWYGNPTKIKSIGFESVISLEEGIKETIKWVKNN